MCIRDRRKTLLKNSAKKSIFLTFNNNKTSNRSTKIYFSIKIKGAVMRVKITLACTECKQRNYNTMKNKKNDPDRLEMNKYCRFCRKHTLHKETK